MVGLILDERAAARPASNRQSGRIVVVGIGDDGLNRVQLMSSHNVPDVSYIVADADTGSPDIVEHDFELIQVRSSGHERHHIWDTDIEFMGTRRNDASASLRPARLAAGNPVSKVWPADCQSGAPPSTAKTFSWPN